jgi:DNA-binding phage protein
VKDFHEFKKALDQVRKDIFEAAFDPNICAMGTINELADKAGLAWATVERLYRSKDGTKNPGLRTIFCLAKAVKMDIKLVREGLGFPVKEEKRKTKQKEKSNVRSR